MKPVDASPTMPSGAAVVAAVSLQGATSQPIDECVANEVPVALEYNGISHAVMLATPCDLEEFALGFSLSEGLIDHADELLECEIEACPEGLVAHLRVTARCESRLKERRRNMTGRTGCGLCGTDSLDAVLRPLPASSAPTRVRFAALRRAVHEMAAHQVLQQVTGATHAAAWCALDGTPRVVREDVGRHNALDKLIGAMQRGGVDAADGLIAVTSRASVEIVQKTAIAGVAVLAAVSAPTDLAVRTAKQAGLLLAGFVRGDRGTVYAGAHRLIDD